MKIEDLGYGDFFESSRKEMGLDDFSVARVMAEHKGAYKLIDQEGEFFAKVTGKRIFEASSREDYPAVGDWVAVKKTNGEQALIYEILARKTIIKRKYGDKNRSGNKTETQIIGTNIDVAFIVESVNRDYNLNRLERYLSLVSNGGVKSAIILNKIDLISAEELNSKLSEIKKRFQNIDIIATSVLDDSGLKELYEYILSGKTYCFLGSSGVGKSSLINKLLADNIIKTKDISDYSDRGKHTTTSREMYFLKNGGIVVDNPGIREVGMADLDVEVNNSFDEINTLAQECKYNDCSHTSESGCAVLSALNSGKLDPKKYSNYIGLKKETDFYEMNEVEKRKKDRQFGKFIKKAKKDIKKYKY